MAGSAPVPPAPITARPGGCTLRVRVVPRSGRTGVDGERDGAVRVRLAAAPVDGEANDALVCFLSKQLGVPRRAIRLVSGDRARDKRIEIDGVTPDAATAALCGRHGAA